jgi:hypothetical protein
MTLGRARINRMFRKSQQKAAAKFEYLALFDNGDGILRAGPGGRAVSKKRIEAHRARARQLGIRGDGIVEIKGFG